MRRLARWNCEVGASRVRGPTTRALALLAALLPVIATDAQALDPLIPSGHGVSQATLEQCIAPFAIELTIGTGGQLVAPFPFDIPFALASYAANLALKFCPPYLEAPPDRFEHPNVAGNCARDWTQPQVASTYSHALQLSFEGIPTLVDDRLFGSEVPYLFFPGDTQIYSPVLPHYWGEIGRPDVFHFNSTVDVHASSIGGVARAGDVYRFRVGHNSVQWRGETLIHVVDYIFIYVPGGFRYSDAIEFAVELGLVAASEIFDPEPHGVFNIVTQGVNVYDTVLPTVALNEDESTYPEIIRAVLSFDPVSGIYTVEAIEPGGVSRSRALGFLQNTVEISDACDTALTLTNSVLQTAGQNPVPGFWKVGDDLDVTWTVTDPGPNLALESNSANVLQKVQVRDTVPPSIVAPPSLVVESASPVPVALGSPLVFDLVDLTAAVENDAPTTFPLGIRDVVWTATDDSGNSNQATQLVNLKAPGTNNRPAANDQVLDDVLSFDPVEITLTGTDPDFDAGSGRFDPLSFSIEEGPGDGFFVAPLLPFFIEDLRIQAALCVDNPVDCDQQIRDQCDDFGTVPEPTFVLNPEYVTVDDDGMSYVIDQELVCQFMEITARNRISKFGPDGSLLASLGLGSSNLPDKLFFDKRGFIYYMTPESGSTLGTAVRVNTDLEHVNIYRWSGSTGALPFLTDDPTAIGVDSQGILYGTDGRVLYAWDSDVRDSSDRPQILGALVELDVNNSFFRSRQLDMAIDSRDHLYISDRVGDIIFKFGPSSFDEAGEFIPGAFIGWLGKCDAGPNCDEEKHRSIGFSCTDATCSVVSSTGPNTPFCKPAQISGDCSSGAGQGQFDEPRGIAIDPNDILYATDYNNSRVQRFTADGFFAGEARSAGVGFGFVLDDFGRPRDVSVNSDHFYILNLEADLLHIFETTPITSIDDSSAKVVYSSDNNFVGSDSFTFRASDGLAESDLATVTINVGRNFRAPTVEGARVDAVEDSGPVSVPLTAEDPDGALDVLTLQIVDPPLHGTIDGLTGGAGAGTPAAPTYTPAPDFAGTDQFTYVAFDGVFTSEPATIVIEVEDINDMASVEAPDPVVAGFGFPVTIAFAFTDVDPDDLHTVSVAWGDGVVENEGVIGDEGPTGPLLVSDGTGNGMVVADHVYTTAASAIDVCITDRVELVEGIKEPTADSTTVCQSAALSVVAMADLSITAMGPDMPITTGDTATFSLFVENNAPQSVSGIPATGLVLTAELMDGIDLESFTTTQGSCDVVQGVVTCDLGALAVGETIEVTVSLALGAFDPGTMLRLRAGVGATETDPTPMNVALIAATVLADSGHDLCGAATEVPPASLFVDYVDTRAASGDSGDPTPSCGSGVDGSTVWYRYAAAIDGTVSVSTEGSDYETVLSVWGPDEACGALSTEVGCDDIGAEEEFAVLDFPVAAGEAYLVEVGDPNAVGGELIISFIPEPDSALLTAIALLTLAGLRSRRV